MILPQGCPALCFLLAQRGWGVQGPQQPVMVQRERTGVPEGTGSPGTIAELQAPGKAAISPRHRHHYLRGESKAASEDLLFHLL